MAGTFTAVVHTIRVVAIVVGFSSVQAATNAAGKVGALETSDRPASIYLYRCETVPSQIHDDKSVATNDDILSISLMEDENQQQTFVADTVGLGASRDREFYANRSSLQKTGARSTLTVGVGAERDRLTNPQCLYTYSNHGNKSFPANERTLPAKKLKLEWKKLDINQTTRVTIVVTFITDHHHGAAVFVFDSSKSTQRSLEFYQPTSNSKMESTMFIWENSTESFTLTITTEENSPLVGAVENGSLTCGMQIGQHGFFNCKSDDTSTTPVEKSERSYADGTVHVVIAFLVIFVTATLALAAVIIYLLRFRPAPDRLLDTTEGGEANRDDAQSPMIECGAAGVQERGAGVPMNTAVPATGDK